MKIFQKHSEGPNEEIVEVSKQVGLLQKENEELKLELKKKE